MEWISCEDKFPAQQQRMLFINGKKEITIGYCFDYEDERRVWIMDDLRVTNEIATHWMPLPEPPLVDHIIFNEDILETIDKKLHGEGIR